MQLGCGFKGIHDSTTASAHEDGVAVCVVVQGVMHSVVGSDLIKAFLAVRHCEVEADPTPQSLLLRY